MLHLRIVVPPDRAERTFGLLDGCPAVFNIVRLEGVAAYSDWSSWRGSLEQLAINIGSIVVAGLLTLAVQRQIYARRHRAHLRSQGRPAGSLRS